MIYLTMKDGMVTVEVDGDGMVPVQVFANAGHALLNTDRTADAGLTYKLRITTPGELALEEVEA